MKKAPAKASRNQNIPCQFQYWLMSPPRIGLNVGPSMLLTEAQAMNVPLSADVVQSPTT